MRLNFKLEAQSGRARAGRFKTLHNEVLTPLFMPVATLGSVRGQDMDFVESSGSQILLANTYHLLLRPGPEVFKKIGGIHPFMKWNRSVLTDSGGFQVFSLSNERKMTEEGAIFRSYIDGSLVMLSPEKSIETQKAIGSDIMMVLDECVPSTCDWKTAKDAMDITHRWALRSLAARGDSPQSMFAIVQGACFKDLRKASADFLTQHPFDGFAIGGLAVGESREERETFTEAVTSFLPQDRPRYLMGVGTPIDLLEAVARGVDMFDCILPAALAQQGVAFTTVGRVNLRRGVYKMSEGALDPNCPCPTCTKHSRAYLHHLIKCNEPLGWELVGTHNLHFYHTIMSDMRQAILEDRFEEHYRQKKPIFEMREDGDEPNYPIRPKVPVSESLGNYEITENTGGFYCIKQTSSGETMHSSNDPWSEAESLYVEQSALKARLFEDAENELVIWDVGLGAATNAMAAIKAIEIAQSEGAKRKVRIVSFENDLDSLKLALKRTDLFEHLRHGAPLELLDKKTYQKNTLTWELHVGDFAELMQGCANPDLVFYDPFSAKVDSPLWSFDFFCKLNQKLSNKGCELFTYSASTAVRASLLASGFFVAEGFGSGPKADTTVAMTVDATRSVRKLLGDEWLKKWQRSSAKIPGNVQNPEVFAERILSHPQFKA